MKVRSKLLLVILLPAMIFVLALSFSLAHLTGQVMHRQIELHLETAASAAQNHLTGYFRENIRHLELIIQANKETISAYQSKPDQESLNLSQNSLTQSLMAISGVNRICFFEKNGDLNISTNNEFIGRSAKGKQFFETGRLTEGVYFIDVDGELEMLVTGPIKENGELLGVMAVVFNLDRMNEIVSTQAGLGESGEVLLAIAGEEGPKFISQHRFVELLTDFSAVNEEFENKAQPMRLALQGQEEFIEESLDYRGENVLAVSKFINIGKVGLVAKIDYDEAFRDLNYLLYVRIISTGIMFILFLIIISLFSKKMMNPIIELNLIAKSVTEGDFSKRITETNRQDEIGVLSRSFNQMIDQLTQSQTEVKNKVAEQTKQIEAKANDLGKQRLAIANVLEDVELEKKKAENQSQELQKYLMAVENASDHIVITDPEGMILFFNPAAEKITGFSEEEVLGQKVGTKDNWGGLMEEKEYKDFWKVVSKDKKAFTGEFKNKRKSGEEYMAHASVTPILNSEGEVIFYVGIERDITKAKKIDRMKTEFISLASHQLRTPLSAIKWFLEMLLAGDAGKLNKEQLEFANNINDSNERMIDLVNSLLNVSRIESGRIIIEPEPTSLKTLVDRVVLELQPKIKEKGHQIIISSHPDLPKINIDPKLIANVYLNLISNAIKYTSENGEIDIFISKKDDQLISQVSDNGIGIPKNQHDSIFNKFFRADNVTKIDTTGNGLGLYLVKTIVDSSGGKIWFESEEGKGAAFFFSLPMAGSPAKEGEVSIS